MEKQKFNLGFTLIELLVVISIIGFLATASMVVLNSARVKARNSKRNQDIKQLMTAFGLAADSAGGAIPATGGTWVCVSSSCYGAWAPYGANGTIDAFIAPYIKKPADPSGGSRDSSGGGYLLHNPVNFGQGTGAYLNWLLERVTNVPGVCGPGFFWSEEANYTQCVAKIEL